MYENTCNEGDGLLLNGDNWRLQLLAKLAHEGLHQPHTEGANMDVTPIPP